MDIDCTCTLHSPFGISLCGWLDVTIWLPCNSSSFVHYQHSFDVIHCPPNFGHGCTKIRNAGRGQAGQHRSIRWPAILGHGWTKIKSTGKRPAGQHKSVHWLPIFGHGWTKIRNTGKRPASQYRSKYLPTNLGSLLDQDQKYRPKIAGMDWYWTNIDPLVCADWVSATSLVQNNCTLW